MTPLAFFPLKLHAAGHHELVPFQDLLYALQTPLAFFPLKFHATWTPLACSLSS